MSLRNLYIFIVLGLCFTLSNLASLSQSPKGNFESNIIFIQQANTAVLSIDPSDPNMYFLTINGIYPHLIYFSLTPQKAAGSVSMKDFLVIWNRNKGKFADDPPNAILSYLNFKAVSPSGVQTDVLELINPQYDSSSNSIHFQAIPMYEYKLKTGSYKNVVIIYDGLDASLKSLQKNTPSSQLSSTNKGKDK